MYIVSMTGFVGSKGTATPAPAIGRANVDEKSRNHQTKRAAEIPSLANGLPVAQRNVCDKGPVHGETGAYAAVKLGGHIAHDMSGNPSAGSNDRGASRALAFSRPSTA